MSDKAGVTTGHVVIWSGGVGDAWLIPVAVLVEDDGTQTIVVSGDAKPGRVVDA